MSKIILTVGPSLTGKSTWANKYAREHPNVIVLCADDLRHYFCNDISDQSKNGIIFQSLECFANIVLDQGFDIILANTTINKKARKKWIQLAKNRMLTLEAVFFDIPIDVCRERGKKRERKIPDDVLVRQFDALERPREEEGFDKITIIR